MTWGSTISLPGNGDRCRCCKHHPHCREAVRQLQPTFCEGRPQRPSNPARMGGSRARRWPFLQTGLEFTTYALAHQAGISRKAAHSWIVRAIGRGEVQMTAVIDSRGATHTYLYRYIGAPTQPEAL
jgi:hypothetical protein